MPDAGKSTLFHHVPREVEAGSDEERELRGMWATRMMFGFLVGIREERSYEQFLADRGVRLA